MSKILNVKRLRPGTRPQDDDEDELVSPGRVTPRGSTTLKTSWNSPSRQESELERLTTPVRHPSSARSATSQRTRLTHSASTRTPVLSRPPRPVPAKRSAPTTPHGLRALQQRRAAALTPGRDRRRSGQHKRDTPRDILRKLSRVEASNTRRVETLPQSHVRGREKESNSDDSNDDEYITQRPSLSVLIGEDEDSFHAAPRLSIDIDDSQYLGSVEAPRRFTGDLGRYGTDVSRTSDHYLEFEDIQLAEDRNSLPPTDQSRGQHSSEIDLRDSNQSINGGLDDSFDSTGSGLGQPRLSENVIISDADVSFALEIPQFSAELNKLRGQNEGFMLRGPSLSSNDFVSPRESNSRRSSYARQPHPKNKLSDDLVKIPKRNHNLPNGFIKKLTRSLSKGMGLRKPQISRDIIDTIALASDWYFEQIGQDLGAYAEHARRQTVDEADVIALMKRQRLLNASTTPFSLAQKFLPRELLQHVGTPPSLLNKRVRKT